MLSRSFATAERFGLFLRYCQLRLDARRDFPAARFGGALAIVSISHVTRLLFKGGTYDAMPYLPELVETPGVPCGLAQPITC